MDSFEDELKNGFLEEASQLISDAEQCFLILETNPQDMPTLEKLFRIAHSIKGSSKAVGFDALGSFTHEFESFMLKCKNGQIPILPKTISLLLKCNDHVKHFLEQLKSNHSAVVESQALIQEINDFKLDEPAPVESPEPDLTSEVSTESDIPLASNAGFESEPAPVSEVPISNSEPASETPVLAPTSVTNEQAAVNTPPPAQSTQNSPSETPAAPSAAPSDQMVNQGASQPAHQPAHQPAPNATEGHKTQSANEESIRVSLSRLEKLLNFVGELVILQTVLKEQSNETRSNMLKKTITQMGKVTKEVQDLSMSLRMVPLKLTFQKMQRIVRDTSSLLGKKVQLTLQGEDTEVDKTVLEALSDPLVHLIRNGVDHGIETPQDRLAKGKPETGQVVLKAYHESGKLIIEVKDDGGGIPIEVLKRKAVEKGILKPSQNISDQDALNLIFHPGFSTKAQVTEVSGRGVGMDVVKTNIEQMQGQILIETQLNQGSTFKIVLPLTLAIIDGMVVKCGEDRYVIPLSHVHESIKPQSSAIKTTAGMGEMLLLRGENLPLIRLSQVLEKKVAAKSSPTEQIAIIVRTQNKPFATLVDDIIGQHQVVIKKLGAEMQNIPGYSGSAILGDGRPALILELGELVSSKKPQFPSLTR